MQVYLDFEKPIAELEGKIQELRVMSQDDPEISIVDEVAKLETKVADQLAKTYKSLDPWQKTQVARHPARPHFKDYVETLVEDFTPLAGDRLFSEDHAIVAGLGRWKGRRVAIMGHEKGNNTQSRIKHNFGMAWPEGYRKAIRIMELAERFNLPLVTLVDDTGAYPGIGARNAARPRRLRGARTNACRWGFRSSLWLSAKGSGGALALATAGF